MSAWIGSFILSIAVYGGLIGLLVYIGIASKKKHDEERQNFDKVAEVAEKKADDKLASTQMITCKYCGMTNIGEADTCKYCGAKLGDNNE